MEALCIYSFLIKNTTLPLDMIDKVVIGDEVKDHYIDFVREQQVVQFVFNRKLFGEVEASYA